jgi:acetyltransferase
MCRQAGVTRAVSAEQAFELAATLSSHPLPKGPRTAVVTLAGGWGVLAADAISRTALELVPLPRMLREEIDRRLPPRWSRRNPIDLAGGERRDTVPEVLDIVAGHEAVDAVLFVGFGIQANTAKFIRASPHFPAHGLDRIARFHESQDIRYALAAAEVSDRFGKPVLSVTELAVTDPTNAAVATVRGTGRLCYPSVERAVAALDHAWRYQRYRDRRAM